MFAVGLGKVQGARQAVCKSLYPESRKDRLCSQGPLINIGRLTIRDADKVQSLARPTKNSSLHVDSRSNEVVDFGDSRAVLSVTLPHFR